MQITVDASQLNDLSEQLKAMPKLFERAKKSALSSTGYMVKGRLKKYVESSGDGSWPEKHPLSVNYTKRYGADSGFIRNRKKTKNKPLYWLGN